jgi:long-chain acyl-CoA synthetase
MTALHPRSLPQYLDHWAAVSPERRFLSDDSGIALTFAETAGAVDALTADLTGRGVGSNDRVAILADNGAAWVIAFLATMATGAVAVPLATRTTTAELEALLDHAEPALMLTDDSNAASVPIAWAGRSQPIPIVIAGTGRVDAHAGNEAPACLTYTSGTTGRPKGVLLSNEALVLASETYAALFHSTPSMHTVVAVPLCHNTGFIDQLGHALVAGGSLDAHRRFRADVIAESIVSGACTFFIGVPTMYHRIVDELGGHVATDLAPWLAFGGAAMPTPLIARIRDVFPRAQLANCYGLSEATSITHIHFVDAEADDGAVGVAVAGTLDRISADGELLIRSRTAMLGYFRDAEATAAKFDGGWLRTGDVAVRANDGVVRVLGRIDDIINRGGEKIVPLEVEEALLRHPAVAEAAVVGITDVDLGEVVAAAIVPRRPLDIADLHRHARSRLADHKCPARVVVVEALPRNANGKVHLAAVRGLFT